MDWALVLCSWEPSPPENVATACSLLVLLRLGRVTAVVALPKSWCCGICQVI